jgi:cyclopropane fatty-acyl-phospholipid synthase-like methyltransferase
MSESKPTIDPYPLSIYTTLAGERNRDPILRIFKTFFPKGGDALELASGSGAHINYFAQHFPGIRFQPSDCDVNVFEIIRSNRARAGNTNVAEPLRIDLTESGAWPNGERLYDVIFAINVFHLAPVSAVDGFAEIGARALKPGGLPQFTAPSKWMAASRPHPTRLSTRAFAKPGSPGGDLRTSGTSRRPRTIAASS